MRRPAVPAFATPEGHTVKKMRTLIVDDSQAFLKAARSLLATIEEVEVVGAATSGEEALREVAHLAPDLVLMDVMMPGMNGFEAARLICAMKRPPIVVFVSLHDGAPYLEAARRSGAAALISKHSFCDDLPALIRHLSDLAPMQ